jgi:hypothetical protein
MARKCFMCGREVTEGILCEKCDKPRRKASEPVAPKSLEAFAEQEPDPAPPAAPSRSRTNTAPAIDPFPKAPVVPFPLESVSPAITSVVQLLVAAGVPAILIGPDRSVKFASEEAKKLFGIKLDDMASLAALEKKAGFHVGDLAVPTSAGVRVGSRSFLYTLVPLSGGASGAVLILRDADPLNQARASFVTYVRDAVVEPLTALRDLMIAASSRRDDPLFSDAAASLDQVLSSLELAPGVEAASSTVRPVPTVTEVVQRVAEQFRAHADLKNIRLDVDIQELEERFSDHELLSDALSILMENALHYVPARGQVVIGVRWMEHKEKPLLLFFVMDTGSLVPEHLRHEIFEPSFVWNPASSERAGRGLFKCREFAVAHSGSVWVESKTGKACTFFLRVRPDGVR